MNHTKSDKLISDIQVSRIYILKPQVYILICDVSIIEWMNAVFSLFKLQLYLLSRITLAHM